MRDLEIYRCPRCKRTGWPIQRYCSGCLAETDVVVASPRGRIIEFSQRDGVYFCVADFDGVRLVCTLRSSRPPRSGQAVTFLSHERTDSGHAFEIGLD